MVKRGRTERNRRRWERSEEGQKHGRRSLGGVVESRVEPAAITGTQTVVASDPQEFELAWAPETEGLSAEAIAKLISSGKGEALRKANLRWAEIRAVRENWPISRLMRERIAFDAMMIMLDPNSSTRDRQVSQRLLVEMDKSNRPHADRLPNQVAEPGTSVEVEVGGTKVTIRSVIDAMVSDPRLGILDLRENPIQPGSKDDYAE